LAALRFLDDNITAEGSNRCRDALYSTWCYVAKQFGVDAILLQRENARCVLAGLRAGGYRTSGAFLARAKQMHLLHVGKPVDEAVDFWCKEYLRSADSGRGAAALKDGFEFTKNMEIDFGTSCLGKLMGFKESQHSTHVPYS